MHAAVRMRLGTCWVREAAGCMLPFIWVSRIDAAAGSGRVFARGWALGGGLWSDCWVMRVFWNWMVVMGMDSGVECGHIFFYKMGFTPVSVTTIVKIGKRLE